MVDSVSNRRAHDRAIRNVIGDIRKCIDELDRLKAPSDIAAHLETAAVRLGQIMNK